MSGMCFDNSYARLSESFFRPSHPNSVVDPKLVALNRPLARDLGMSHPELLDNEGFLSSLLSGNQLPVGAKPIATAYAGHQFGVFVSELGDDRAVLLGEVIDRCQQRKDIQLIGIGRTPFTRDGDGRYPLAEAVREYVMSEAMHALGVPTTRSLALTVAGGRAGRGSPEPCAILARVATCHISIGTFEYFARHQKRDELQTLADYAIARLCPELMMKPDPYLSLLRWAVDKQARLVAHWVSLGFVHGVMDTDKTSIAGETLDYGASAFLDYYDPDTTPNALDVTGRYAFSSQAFAAQWNLSRLAEALIGLFYGGESRAVAEATRAVREFQVRYEDYLLDRMRARLGLEGAMPEDRQLIQDFRQLLARSKTDYHSFFHKLAEDTGGGGITAALFDSDAALYLDWYRRWHLRLTVTGRTPEQCFEALRNANPLNVPVNDLINSAVEHAHNNDFNELDRLLNLVKTPFAKERRVAG
jgi:uncharacterized protein YdiU (UPF0061 family)